MKKIISILLASILSLFIFTSCKPSVDNIKIDNEKSYFWGYDVNDITEMVDVYYNINFENTSSQELQFYIKGNFSDLVDGKLITSENLYSANEDGKRITYKIEANAKKSIMVHFYDVFGGTEMDEEALKAKGLPKDLTIELVEKK